MKGSMKRLLTVCLFAGMLGSYSTMVGSAYGNNYKYVFSEDEKEETPGSGMISKAIRAIEAAIVAAAAVTAVGAGVDVYKNGYKDSKTEGFVSSAAELAKEVYFTPKNWIANKVSPKIVENADFVETMKYLSTKDSSDATFMGEIKGLGNVIKEIGVHIYHLVRGK